jgi:hypothetical protein
MLVVAFIVSIGMYLWLDQRSRRGEPMVGPNPGRPDR